MTTTLRTRRILVMLLVVALALVLLPVANAVAGANHGERSRYCEILVWFDQAYVEYDTDLDEVDNWSLEGVLRTRPERMPREEMTFVDTTMFPPPNGNGLMEGDPSAIGLASFEADMGETVILEQQWSTEIWDKILRKHKKRSFRDAVPLQDMTLTVRERDGRGGDDIGTVHLDIHQPLPCGDTFYGQVDVWVEPKAARGMPSDDAPGYVWVDFTITTVDATYWMPPYPCKPGHICVTP